MKYRALSDYLPASSKNRLIVLTGARQTGKTTLAQYKYPNLRYINLDAPENRETLKGISAHSWSAAVGNAVIDEAQKAPEVFEKIKFAFDEKGITFTVLLGSSQILLLKKIRESLAGRVSLYELWPLLMSELHAEDGSKHLPTPLIDRILTGDSLDDVLESVPPILLGHDADRAKETERHLLKWGGMPSLLPLTSDERWKWLKDYQYTYLERDLGDLARLDDLTPFTKFQKLTALRSGSLLNYAELARDAQMSADTARRYLEYLRLSYQVLLLQPYHRNLTSSTVKTPKIYWTDIGLMRQLSGRREETTGEMYETMVIAEIHKWIKTAQRNAEIYFYRTHGGLEIDLLIVLEKGIMGVEIKGRKNVISSDFRPMREISESLKKEWLGGIVVYQGDEIRKWDASKSLWAVPSKRLFL